MKWVLILMLTVFAGGFSWRIFSLLSSDAIAMAIGMAMGVLAGLPAAALILLSQKEAEQADDYEDPPIIVVYSSPPPEQPVLPASNYLYTRPQNPQLLLPRQDPAEVERIHREQSGTQAQRRFRNGHL